MSTNDIPVIDIGKLGNRHTLAALEVACREWGFFQVVGHGIEPKVMADLDREMRGFFALPRCEKRAVARNDVNPWGFFDSELTKNVKDWKEIFDYGPAFTSTDGLAVEPQWPGSRADFRTAVESFYRACEQLGFALLEAISVNLGVSRQYLRPGFEPDHTSFVRLNYYPQCPKPARPTGRTTAKAGHLGVNHHTDAGALTLLLQDDVPGLEVFRHGAWHLVEPRAGALVINIGDIVQVWSNDRYKASMHRVAASGAKERYSAPFFFNPAYWVNYAPLPSTVGVGAPARYRSINWGEFRQKRAAGDYADCGEEIQITHYAVG